MILLLWLACSPDTDADGSPDAADCKLTDPLSFPGAPERCDAADNDCDGEIDEGFDLDGDGYLINDAGCRWLGRPTDCNDDDAAVHPDAAERCDDRDNNCDGQVDNLADADGDGYSLCEDCDDDAPFTSPGQPEVCDGLDNDCDLLVDEGWDSDGDGSAPCAGDCDDYDPRNGAGLEEVCDGADNNCDQQVDEGFDEDGDGVTTCRGDCDDTNAAISPLEAEVCDGIDNDCDGGTTEDGDADGDGYSFCGGDCLDSDATVAPGLPEQCDDLDNDCDGFVEADPACWGCVASETYLVCSEYRTWPQANAACEAMGVHLVSIGDADENLLVSSFMYDSIWLGLHDLNDEGTFEWTDATPLVFSNWWGGEPNDYGGEDCAATNYGDVGYWNDFGCEGSSLPFVCEL